MRANWALIAIVAGALLTAAAVITIFVSSARTADVAPRLVTVADLSRVPDGSSASSVTVSVDNGCAWSIVDGQRALGIWPTGFTLGDGVLRDAEGEPFEGGTASVLPTDERGALDLADDEDYLRALLEQCLEPAGRVDIVTEIVAP